MIKLWKKILKILCVTLSVSVSFFLIGCGNSGDETSSSSIITHGFELNYNGNTKLEKVGLKTDDLEEISELFQEVGNNSEFKDSLLIASRYDQGLGVNAFAQDNLETLKEQGLTLSNVKKTQIWLKKDGEKINAVLVEYEITQGLVNEIPLLYVSQLFMPQDNEIILMSFITENRSSQSSASNMFKNIK